MEIDEIITYITAVVTIASIITTVTPTPRDDNWIGKAYKIIEALALVVGKAKQ